MVLVSTRPELVLLCPTGVCNPNRPLPWPSDASAQSTPASWHGTEPVQGFTCTSCLILWCGEEERRKNTEKMQHLTTQPCPRAEEKVESGCHLGSRGCALVLGG